MTRTQNIVAQKVVLGFCLTLLGAYGCSERADACAEGMSRVDGQCVEDEPTGEMQPDEMALISSHPSVCDPYCKLVATDTTGKPLPIAADFGRAVALQDPYLMVGAKESVYVYKRTVNGQWKFLQLLTASDNTSPGNFGVALAIQGSLLVVGAPLRDTAGEDAGGVYMFNLVEGRWVETGILLHDNARFYDQLGISFAFHGNRLAVGATHYRAVGDFEFYRGRAYVFERGKDGVYVKNGTFGAMFMDGKNDDASGYGFGESVALTENSVFVAAPRRWTDINEPFGGVYTFEQDANGRWSITDLLTPSIFSKSSFGSALAYRKNTLYVGNATQFPYPYKLVRGALYTFRRNASDPRWTKTGEIYTNDAIGIGQSIAIDGSHVLVGASKWTSQVVSNPGAVLIYEEQASGTLRQTHVLTVDGATQDDAFGKVLAVHGRYVVAGSSAFHNREPDTGPGAVFIFDNVW